MPFAAVPACLTHRLARRLALLVLDVDGVLTDGGLWFGPRGETLKRFHVRDGHGIKLLRAAGIEVAVVSGRRSAAVNARCRELGVKLLLQGVADKSQALDRLLQRLSLTDTQVACIGDDTPDVPLFVRVALAVAVRDAHPLAIRAAHCRTTLPGGQGAVREVVDWILASRGRP
ncbi:MAG TPA: HAD-IIIA family hydrolase [Steroidobacteraceae bacterium]|nr:HAD-IIIA family hydrolase [Steroidobacteraceae bacterium]